MSDLPLCLDLFCGTGSATAPIREHGCMQVVGFDLSPKAKGRDVTADVRHLPIDPEVRPRFVWASPPCQLYSYVRTFNKRTGEKYRYNPDIRPWRWAEGWAYQSEFYVIENVLGAKRTWGEPEFRFGPWCLWTNLPSLNPGPVPGKGKLIWHPEISRTQRRSSDIPLPLAEAVHRAVCPSPEARA